MKRFIDASQWRVALDPTGSAPVELMLGIDKCSGRIDERM
jgi:hypothetical protein